MKRIFALLFASFVSVMMAACSIVIDGEEKTTAQKVDSKGAIGLSVSTLNNPFFVTLVEGAKKAAVELNVNITVVDAGDNVSKQVSDIEDLVSKNVSILIVNAVDSDALTGAVKAAKSKGVKVISVDRAINGVEVDCQIASDNVAGAELATQYIVDKLGEGVVTAELQGTMGSSAAIDRGKGFHNIADAKLNVVASQTANFNRTEGMSVMENMLQANGNIAAVFAANDEMALGAVEASSGAGKKVMVVGFDATDDAVEAIKAGRMAATIAQQPGLIGETAVRAAVDLNNGKSIEKNIPVKVTLVTAENADKLNADKPSFSGTIGLSVSTLNNPFFVTLVEGAKKTAAELKLALTVVDAGDNVSKQVSDIEDLISKNVSILIVNAVDSDALTGAVKVAKSKGVKVISVDRAINGVEVDCQIASDNVAGAELATQYIVDKLGEGVITAELQGTLGSSAAIDRGKGFHNIADKKLKVAASQTANFNRTEGMSVMENMLQANGKIAAVFAANDEMALGAVEASSGAGKKVMVVGFDATDDAVEAIKAGRMAATIAQQPALIGETAVRTAMDIANGKVVEKNIPVKVTLVTAENAGK
ncbi:ribose transport system substrate-binding protein [Fibrobacter sp. UWH6]|nr:substrate-binding domain-containing protein [Fibrobacter sp. UWH6]SHL16080.1 ribose transport system substrate-binding protein [Fibrobacter sp. UWH6]